MNATPAEAAPQPETLDSTRLLERLSASQDFPAFSQVVAQVNQLTTSEDTHAEQLTDIILKDVALTNKLLRLVNAAQFGRFGHQPVSTISRAVIILGYDTVRDAALSLLLFEHLHNHAQAQELKAETIDSFYCGVLGRLLARQLGHRDTEQMFICAMFRTLGKLMARLHFFEATKQVSAILQQGMSEERAARQVLGLSYDEIGQAIARHWRLPATILQAMRPLPDGPVTAAAAKHQVIANLAWELFEAVKRSPEAALDKSVSDIARRYANCVDLSATQLVEAIYQASEMAEQELAALHTDARQSPLLCKLFERRPTAAAALAEPDVEQPVGPAADGSPEAVLINGLEELTQLLLEQAHPHAMLQVGAELLYRTGCFDNVILSTVDAGNQFLTAHIGHGADWARLRKAFRIPLAFQADVFHAAIAKAADILISDTEAESIRSRIPDWYRRLVTAKSFLLLPICLGNRCVAMIYADRRDATLRLSPQTLGLVKSVRNQITLAMRGPGRH